jgi:DNA-binding transcriptional regulator GbsR (MarR family)
MSDAEKKKQELVEKTGVLLEQFGFQRMTGRIMGYLVLAEPPYKTFDDIREYLQASKSSVSTSLQLLIMQGQVTYFTLPGDRKRYFKFNAESFLELFKRDMARMVSARTMVEEFVSLRSNEHESFNNALLRIAKFYEFMEREMPELIRKWEEENS